MMTDSLHVVHARAAGLDVHKMQITVSVRLCVPGAGEPQVETHCLRGERVGVVCAGVLRVSPPVARGGAGTGDDGHTDCAGHVGRRPVAAAAGVRAT